MPAKNPREGRADVRLMGGTVLVSSPFNGQFVTGARLLGGSWLASSKTWSFPTSVAQEVVDLCRRTYRTVRLIDLPGTERVQALSKRLEELRAETLAAEGEIELLIREGVHALAGTRVVENTHRDPDAEDQVAQLAARGIPPEDEELFRID